MTELSERPWLTLYYMPMEGEFTIVEFRARKVDQPRGAYEVHPEDLQKVGDLVADGFSRFPGNVFDYEFISDNEGSLLRMAGKAYAKNIDGAARHLNFLHRKYAGILTRLGMVPPVSVSADWLITQFRESHPFSVAVGKREFEARVLEAIATFWRALDNRPRRHAASRSDRVKEALVAVMSAAYWLWVAVDSGSFDWDSEDANR